jgi:hypothetical protein
MNGSMLKNIGPFSFFEFCVLRDGMILSSYPSKIIAHLLTQTLLTPLPCPLRY